MSNKEGELYEKCIQFAIQLSDFNYKLRKEQPTPLSLLTTLDEAKADFPLDMSIWLPWAKSIMKQLSAGENPDPFKVQQAQMLLWFEKWFVGEST
jgi:hypothetical protein